MKKVLINTEYVTLGQTLKILNFIQTGGEAKMFLKEHQVFVNNEPENRRGRKLTAGMVIKINDQNFCIDKK